MDQCPACLMCWYSCLILWQDEYRHLIAGGTAAPKTLPNPSPDWLSDRSWAEILTLPCLVKKQFLLELAPFQISQYCIAICSQHLQHLQKTLAMTAADSNEFLTAKSPIGPCSFLHASSIFSTSFACAWIKLSIGCSPSLFYCCVYPRVITLPSTVLLGNHLPVNGTRLSIISSAFLFYAV